MSITNPFHRDCSPVGADSRAPRADFRRSAVCSFAQEISVAG